MTARARPFADKGSRPFLPRHLRLRFDPLRQAWALLGPEKVLWPDEISLAILRRCDGRTPVATIAADLAGEYEAPPDAVEADVLAFVQDWSDRMVLKLMPPMPDGLPLGRGVEGEPAGALGELAR